MKIFALSSFLTYSAFAGAAIIGNSNPAARLRRDVTDLTGVSEYLPPPTADYLPPAQVLEALQEATTELPEQDSSKLGVNGYEYRTVRRLRLRHRRDVAHLNQHYLPPLPSKEYLPPLVNDAVNEAEEIIAQPSKEYLPPLVDEKLVSEPRTDAPTTTDSPTTTTESVPSTTESLDLLTTTVEPAIEEVTSSHFLDVPQHSAVLLADGYHYEQPEMKKDELKPVTLQSNSETEQYLPPLNDEDDENMNVVLVVEGPDNGESATLAADGYHYRAVKRYRF